MSAEALRRGFEAWLVRIWYREGSAGDRLLAALAAPIALPLSALVGRIARARAARTVRQIGRPGEAAPVVVVGNIVAGGAGKTPVAIALATELRRRGWRPGLLARGYRSEGDGERLVDAATPVAAAGDEALLLARATGCPVAVGAARAQALALLLRSHPDCDVVVSDDGLQHPSLPRRLELVVVDARGLGNGRCLPAGPLREPPERLATVDALLLGDGVASGPPSAGGTPAWPLRGRFATWQTLDGRLRWTTAEFVASARGEPLAALAGIARPARFFDALRALGLAPRCHALADHARIDPAWLAGLDGRWILMTAKDAVKLDAIDAASKARCVVVGWEVSLDDGLVNWIDAALRGRAVAPPRARSGSD